jgi:hypothetical protein
MTAAPLAQAIAQAYPTITGDMGAFTVNAANNPTKSK